MNRPRTTDVQRLVLTEVHYSPLNLTLSEVCTRIAKRTAYQRYTVERGVLELVEQGRLIEDGPYILAPGN